MLTPRPLQQRLQCTAPLNPINQVITALINTSSLVRHSALTLRDFVSRLELLAIFGNFGIF